MVLRPGRCLDNNSPSKRDYLRCTLSARPRRRSMVKGSHSIWNSAEPIPGMDPGTWSPVSDPRFFPSLTKLFHSLHIFPVADSFPGQGNRAGFPGNPAGPEEFRALYAVFRDRPEPENCNAPGGGSAAGIVQYSDLSF